MTEVLAQRGLRVHPLVSSARGPDATTLSVWGIDMVKAHPYRSVLIVLAVMLVTLFISGMIGQRNDGPWGGLPEWLGAVTWFGFLLSALVMVVLSVYLLAAHLQWRRQTSRST